MLRVRRCKIRFMIVLSALCLIQPAFCQSSKRPFTPTDDVGLTQFNWYNGSEIDPARDIKYSPDHRYFAVVTEKGRLDLNTPEDTIWLFRTKDVENLIQHPWENATSLASPLISGAAKAPTIGTWDMRWA